LVHQSQATRAIGDYNSIDTLSISLFTSSHLTTKVIILVPISSMSTPNQSSTDRSYPLSPTPNTTEIKKPQESFHPPRTPQSPPQPALPSPEKRPVETSAADPMSSTTTRSEVNTAVSGSSRMAGSIDTSGISPHMDDPSNKRKREVADTGLRDQKKVHVEDRKLGIEDLHLDVGKKYLLCRTRKTPFFTTVCTGVCQFWHLCSSPVIYVVFG
jgi:hypothetical protein